MCCVVFRWLNFFRRKMKEPRQVKSGVCLSIFNFQCCSFPWNSYANSGSKHSLKGGFCGTKIHSCLYILQSFIVPKENLVLSGHSCQCQVTIQDAFTSLAGFCTFTWDGLYGSCCGLSSPLLSSDGSGWGSGLRTIPSPTGLGFKTWD